MAVREVGGPADRLVRDPQALEDLVVETLLAEQQLVDLLAYLTTLKKTTAPCLRYSSAKFNTGKNACATG